ncbi:DUF3073 domain-containing protein [Amnibacterium flavum]|uniref:DUF3073 domain-containing protein n=1 Tax=Amnibacterium flavum TaxID=2173173 RepID=A0A2V1HUF7_9MICO|nr:DUF3073 domain-containing protein [Amnibacterium flavum]PVZ95322.1 DUF3073 domain-containing protein [Amnibacterium flavum]
MGRGRQKAKHTKVARELKYFSPATNYDALERELGTGPGPGDAEYDKWAEYAEESAENRDESRSA